MRGLRYVKMWKPGFIGRDEDDEDWFIVRIPDRNQAHRLYINIPQQANSNWYHLTSPGSI